MTAKQNVYSSRSNSGQSLHLAATQPSRLWSAFSECTLFLGAHITCLRLESLGKMDCGFGEVMSGTTVGGKSQSYKPQTDWVTPSGTRARPTEGPSGRLSTACRRATSFYLG